MNLTTEELVAHLQSAFDLVKGGSHRLELGDDLQTDLDLDSLDAIDLMSVLEEEIPRAVIDRAIDSMGDVRTVGDLVELLHSCAGADVS